LSEKYECYCGKEFSGIPMFSITINGKSKMELCSLSCLRDFSLNAHMFEGKLKERNPLFVPPVIVVR